MVTSVVNVKGTSDSSVSVVNVVVDVVSETVAVVVGPVKAVRLSVAVSSSVVVVSTRVAVDVEVVVDVRSTSVVVSLSTVTLLFSTIAKMQLRNGRHDRDSIGNDCGNDLYCCSCRSRSYGSRL